MKKAIVTTTINGITKAIRLFERMEGWTLIVAGDIKTPPNYRLEQGIYLSPSDQEEIDEDLSDLIGWNCIQRRNFALLHALRSGVEYVCMVDDDNIPLDNWGQEFYLNSVSSFKQYETSEICFDPIGATDYSHLWHRGFPLDLIPYRNYDVVKETKIQPNIQANFWNGEPDIDAICRMEHRPVCSFKFDGFPFTSNAVAPFNSQNTIISREVMKNYFLYPHVGRMDDIWAAFYVQSLGYKVVFAEPTVFQDRNPHNLLEDMKKEYLGYENNTRLLLELRKDPESISYFLPDRSRKAWQRYKEIVAEL